MSCYFRHMKDILEEAGIKVTKYNKKEIDTIIHALAGIEYKNCSPTWKAIKDQIRSEKTARDRFVQRLKQELKTL
jgi:predicted Fe-Mo cluster-binding NifX family protein